MEFCDVYDAAGQPTGRVVSRGGGAKLSRNEFILVVQVWIRNEVGQYLVQQRAHHLLSAPGIWATTAGHVVAGEDSLAGAIREVREELGVALYPESLKRLMRFFEDNLMQDVWLVEVSQHVVGTPVIGDEVADWMWASRRVIDEMVSQGRFFAYRYLTSL